MHGHTYINIIQCLRCQKYGHTKSSCNKPFLSVKYCGFHNSKDCKKKSQETSAKCALVVVVTPSLRRLLVIL